MDFKEFFTAWFFLFGDEWLFHLHILCNVSRLKSSCLQSPCMQLVGEAMQHKDMTTPIDVEVKKTFLQLLFKNVFYYYKSREGVLFFLMLSCSTLKKTKLFDSLVHILVTICTNTN